MRELIDRFGRVPRHCVWEITLSCNMRCKHCGSAAGAARPVELTTEEALGVCDELAALGTRQVTLSGGEPLLRQDWDVITKRLVDHGIRVNMVSNGFAVTDSVVERAKAAGLTNIGVSLDGLRDTHDRIRVTPGAFDRVLQAWERCAAGGLAANAVTCIFKWNLDELPRIYDLLVQHGIKDWQFQLAEPMGNMEQYREGLVDAEVIPQLLSQWVGWNREGKIRVVLADCLGYYSPHEFEIHRFPKHPKTPFWTGCYAGCQVVGIWSNGDVCGCLSIRDQGYVEGNLRETSLREIWNRKDAFAYNRQFTLGDLAGECAACEYGQLCRGGCTSMSVALAGKPHADPWCYQVVRKRQLEAAQAEREDTVAANQAGVVR
ncbi:radical SAM/SPASM domain-containing protein [Planctomycetota bacterium]